MSDYQNASRRFTLLGGATIAALFAAPVAAQTSSPPPPQGAPPAIRTTGPQGNSVSEVIVTAQRREQRLSRVPVSVEAFSASQLQSKAITSEQDIGTLVPGLQVKNGQTSNQLSFSLRGQTLDPFSGTSAAVLTYLNEAPYQPYQTATDFFDLGSVQVLKGPQGTLFGRNATGGAVLYSTPKPADQLDGYIIVRGGDRNYVQIQGAVDLPIVKDLLSVRLAGDVNTQNGYIHNLETGKTLGDTDDHSARATILYTPTSKFTNTLLLQYSKFGGTEGSGNIWDYYTNPNALGQQFINNGVSSAPNTTGNKLTSTLDTVYNVYSGLLFNTQGYNIGNSNLTPGPAVGPGRFPGGVPGYAAFSRANPYDVYIQYNLPHRADMTFLSNTSQYDFSDQFQLKNIFTYTNSITHLAGQLTGGPFGSLYLFNGPDNATGLSGTGGPGGQVFKSHQLSDEIQAQGNFFDDKLHYTVGAFYSSFDHFDIIPIFVGSDINPNLGAAAAFGLPADIDYTYNSKDDSEAVYAQADYKITDKLTFTAGGRYTWEQVSLSQAQGSIFSIEGLQAVGVKQSKDLSAPSWTFTLQYQLTPENMIYGAQRGSFRAGNFNGTVTPLDDDNSFKSELAHDYEVGYKYSGRLLDRPFRFNAALYDEIVINAQHAVYAVVDGNPAGFTLNVPEARTRGVELDSTFQPIEWLNVTFAGAYTDAEYPKGLVNVSNLTGTPGSIINFDSYPDSPKFSGTLGADVTLPMAEELGKLILHGEVYSQTSVFFSSNDGSVTPGTELPSYTVVNMRLSWNNIRGTKASAAVYVKNIANDLYYVSGYALGASAGVNTAYPGAPRTIAGEVSLKF